MLVMKQAPKIECECGKEMVLEEQDLQDDGSYKLNYKCECGLKAKALVNKRGLVDRYIYDKEGKLLKYDSGFEDEV